MVNMKKVKEYWPIIAFCLLIAYALIQTYFWASEIPAINKQLNEYTANEAVMREKISNLEKKIEGLEERFYNSLLSKSYDIESRIFKDKISEVLEPKTSEYAVYPSPWAMGYENLEGTYKRLKDEYKTFLKNNPEKSKEIDVPFEILKERKAKVKPEKN